MLEQGSIQRKRKCNIPHTKSSVSSCYLSNLKNTRFKVLMIIIIKMMMIVFFVCLIWLQQLLGKKYSASIEFSIVVLFKLQTYFLSLDSMLLVGPLPQGFHLYNFTCGNPSRISWGSTEYTWPLLRSDV